MYPPDLPNRMQALIDSGEPEGALEAFVREVMQMPEHELTAYRQLPMWKGRVALAPTIPREMAIDRVYRFNAQKFANHQVPTLLLLGGDSPDVFRQAVETVHSALRTSQVVILPGQRHVAMDTGPELFVREVRRFWSDQQPPVEGPSEVSVNVGGNDGKDHLA